MLELSQNPPPGLSSITQNLFDVYGEGLYNTTKGRRPTINDSRFTINDSRFTIHDQRIMEGEPDWSAGDSKMTITDVVQQFSF